MKQTFVMYASWQPVFDNLSDADAAKMIRSIYAYQTLGEMPDNTWAHYPTFLMFKETMDKDTESYNAKVDRMNKNRGKKLDRSHDDINMTSDRNQNDITVVTSDTDTVTDTKEKEIIVSGYFNDPDLDKSFSDYVDMRMRMNAPVDFMRVQKQLYDMAKGDKKQMIAILENSITNGYKGLIAPKEARGQPPDKKGHFATERNYDFDAIEKQFVKGAGA